VHVAAPAPGQTEDDQDGGRDDARHPEG